MARTKRVATGLQADIIASATGKGKEPEWNQLVPPTRLQLITALNFYKRKDAYKQDHFKEFAVAWARKNRPEVVALFEAAKPKKFTSLGPIMRMATRGMLWADSTLAFVNAEIEKLAGPDKGEELDDDGNLILDEPAKPKKKSKPKINANEQAFDDALDLVHDKWNPSLGVMFEIDAAQDVDGVIARANEMLEHFKVENIQQYPLHMKPWLKAVIEKLSSIQKTVKAKPARKQRTRKINPLKMIQKVKYLKRDDALGIDSQGPVVMVGKQKIYLYDTKYKKLTKLVCANASGFVIKGTTVMNFDPEKSSVAFIKKPAAELKSNDLGIRALDRVMNSSKSKRVAEPKGRINEFTLILTVS